MFSDKVENLIEEIYTNTKYFSEEKDLSQHRCYYVYIMSILNEMEYDCAIISRTDSVWRLRTLKKNSELLYEMTNNHFCQKFLEEQDINDLIIELYNLLNTVPIPSPEGGSVTTKKKL